MDFGISMADIDLPLDLDLCLVFVLDGVFDEDSIESLLLLEEEIVVLVLETFSLIALFKLILAIKGVIGEAIWKFLIKLLNSLLEVALIGIMALDIIEAFIGFGIKKLVVVEKVLFVFIIFSLILALPLVLILVLVLLILLSLLLLVVV
eukprot:jgi/Orpsp1_1/1186956/evm.model.d7180000054365.1